MIPERDDVALLVALAANSTILTLACFVAMQAGRPVQS